ncbi:unnamed protein product [Linum tenue]|uniref:TauD/TfdA-like domain-containing protein n=1 Tax=Linum tenue TaxID=586396 RepID=A0AAV0M788_9ROSI|nr:unnamed protein product [Linum tenue]
MAYLFSETHIPNQKRLPNSPPFPAVLSPAATRSPTLLDFTSAIETQKPYLDTLLHETGAILFRGFPLSTASYFNQAVEAFGFPDYPYVGGAASRTKVSAYPYASSSPFLAPAKSRQRRMKAARPAFVSPVSADGVDPFCAVPGPSLKEEAVPEFPTKLFFFCEVEPASGGETPMVLSHVVYERMKEKYPDFVGRLEDEGLLANRVLTEERRPFFRHWPRLENNVFHT